MCTTVAVPGPTMRRHEPRLRNRLTDRLEDLVAGLLVLIAALGLLVAVTAGAAAHADTMARSGVEASSRISTTAILSADAPVLAGSEASGSYLPQTTAAAAWTAPDGTPRTGAVPVSPGARKGRKVAIWMGRDGALAAAPPSPFVAVVAAGVAGGEVLVITALVLAGAWWVTRRTTARMNHGAWEREWAAIEPLWRRNTG